MRQSWLVLRMLALTRLSPSQLGVPLGRGFALSRLAPVPAGSDDWRVFTRLELTRWEARTQEPFGNRSKRSPDPLALCHFKTGQLPFVFVVETKSEQRLPPG